ncbi:hypothetical protein [Bacillus sp. FJAT-45037]|uniref:hypothetical protein n=1 Tax=Bacillus sp. FJAT-45037 TaxID=2011007 RepID=UPI000C234372|nr:hypothetical protein [Bacillus sp. FJAT-45037]
MLILSGSGPLNRDGNGKGKKKFELYDSLSEAFVECGYATLRYDKRGVGETTGDYHEAGMWDLISDARASIRRRKLCKRTSRGDSHSKHEPHVTNSA